MSSPRALAVAAVQQRAREDAAVCRLECHPQPDQIWVNGL